MMSASSVWASKIIRVGLALPKNAPGMEYVNGMYEHFGELVEKETSGELQVQLYYGGVLGKPDERINYMRRNIIQMTDGSDGNYATIYRDIQVFSMPYLFPTEAVAYEVLDGPIGDRMAADIRLKTGVRVLGWWEAAGFKHFSSNEPIYEPQDMKNKKMRVMSAVFAIPVTAMGGSAMPIPFSELYIGLKTGVVDGQDNSAVIFNMLKLYEVQKYLTLDGHVYSFGPLGINDEFFLSLSREEQIIVQNAAKEAIRWNRKKSPEVAQSAMKHAQENGVTIIPVSSELKSRFEAATRPAAVEWLKSTLDTPSLVDEVINEVARVSAKQHD